MSALLVAMSGANYIHDIAGLIESDLTVSYEKLVVDNEILGMSQRVLRGIEVNDDTLAFDLIIQKGPEQDYMAEKHTACHMRDEFFFPNLSNRERRQNFKSNDDALERARNVVREIRTKEKKSCLAEVTRNSILANFPEIYGIA
jgi:trimethylamine--corrinoid protein Co-methyltransferase